jgi:hypothetical protein
MLRLQAATSEWSKWRTCRQAPRPCPRCAVDFTYKLPFVFTGRIDRVTYQLK